LVSASAFYEWLKGPAKAEQPFAIAMADGSPMTLAGLWDSWRDRASGERVQSFTIITGPPNALTGRLHDRMPVILEAEDWPRWLGEEDATPEELLALLCPYPAEAMTAWPVGAAVGNVRNEGPELLDAIRPPIEAPS
jgi:putative SOS response-associated peptidase YedK